MKRDESNTLEVLVVAQNGIPNAHFLTEIWIIFFNSQYFLIYIPHFGFLRQRKYFLPVSQQNTLTLLLEWFPSKIFAAKGIHALFFGGIVPHILIAFGHQ
ncbi:hypothetical protein [Massilia horti]|uniref:Uncharacterized protein n=1 Tax=Massilia horti TaxID=2562153 RepID=A0A4Y9T0T3_9BURK|nr:hypothetical protein [Massilia horti]TFW32406.1 hypothetical protein E4O92_09925 [Massilia horti]